MTEKPPETSLAERLYGEVMTSQAASFIWNETREAMAWLSKDGVIQATNPAFSRYLGYASSELVGTELSSIAAPSDMESTGTELERLHRGEQREFTVTQKYKTKYGQLLAARLRVVPWTEGGGVVFAQFLPLDILSIDTLPLEEQKRVLQMLVGQWLMTNWRKVLGVLAACAGVTNLDRVLGALFGG